MPIRGGGGGGGADPVDPLIPTVAWDSGDLSTESQQLFSDGTYTVGGKTMSVANSGNATNIGFDGSNGLKIETPSDGVMYSSANTSVQVYWDVSDLIGETPQPGYLYIAQFIISSASDEPSTVDDGMIMGFYADPTSLEQAAVYQHLTNSKRLFGGATRIQTVGDLGTDLITCNLTFCKDWYYGVQLSSSEKSTPIFDDDGLTTTIQDTNPCAIDTTGTFRLVWGSFVYPAVQTTNSYILKRVRLWVFGK